MPSAEMDKPSEKRNKVLQPGPLQQSTKHPGYVNILMKDLREPFIAHMGAFDETELGLWILNDVQFHSQHLANGSVEVRWEGIHEAEDAEIAQTLLSSHRRAISVRTTTSSLLHSLSGSRKCGWTCAVEARLITLLLCQLHRHQGDD